MSMDLLQKQIEARLYAWKLTYGGVVAGSKAAATAIGLCLWRHRLALPVFRTRDARRKAGAVNAERDNADPPKGVTEAGPNDKEIRDASPQTGDPGTRAEVTVYK